MTDWILDTPGILTKLMFQMMNYPMNKKCMLIVLLVTQKPLRGRNWHTLGAAWQIIDIIFSKREYFDVIHPIWASFFPFIIISVHVCVYWSGSHLRGNSIFVLVLLYWIMSVCVHLSMWKVDVRNTLTSNGSLNTNTNKYKYLYFSSKLKAN